MRLIAYQWDDLVVLSFSKESMSQILKGIEKVLCQTDDVLIFGRTETKMTLDSGQFWTN
jgi:hypothetical protein